MLTLFRLKSVAGRTGLAALVSALTGVAAPAEARIVCRNGYQMVAGNAVSTPYCQDDLIATVARGYGLKSSPARVRAEPNHKREICRFIGRDIRLYEACVNTSPSVKGRPL